MTDPATLHTFTQACTAFGDHQITANTLWQWLADHHIWHVQLYSGLFDKIRNWCSPA